MKGRFVKKGDEWHMPGSNRKTIQMQEFSNSNWKNMTNWSRIVMCIGRYVVENVWVEACWIGIALLYTPGWNDAFGMGAGMRWDEPSEIPWSNDSTFVVATM